MKYAIIKCINGNFSIHAEGFTSLAAVKVNYHELCQILWNAQDVITATVMIVDEQMDCVEDYKEFIFHEPVNPTPAPEPEQNPEESGEGE